MAVRQRKVTRMLWLPLILTAVTITITVTIVSWVLAGVSLVARDEITEPIDDLDP